VALGQLFNGADINNREHSRQSKSRNACSGFLSEQN
jgi:hypothetical protein